MSGTRFAPISVAHLDEGSILKDLLPGHGGCHIQGQDFRCTALKRESLPSSINSRSANPHDRSA